MSSSGQSSADVVGLRSQFRRGRRQALGKVIVIGLLAAVAEVLPVGFAFYGGVLLLGWLQQRWDATWNDGDGWIAGAGTGILMVILFVAATAVHRVARAGDLPPRATVLITTAAGLAAAALGSAVLVGMS